MLFGVLPQGSLMSCTARHKPEAENVFRMTHLSVGLVNGETSKVTVNPSSLVWFRLIICWKSTSGTPLSPSYWTTWERKIVLSESSSSTSISLHGLVTSVHENLCNLEHDLLWMVGSIKIDLCQRQTLYENCSRSVFNWVVQYGKMDLFAYFTRSVEVTRITWMISTTLPTTFVSCDPADDLISDRLLLEASTQESSTESSTQVKSPKLPGLKPNLESVGSLQLDCWHDFTSLYLSEPHWLSCCLSHSVPCYERWLF